VYLKIYSSGFRLVRDFEFNKLDSPDFLTRGTHKFYWDGKDEQNRRMPPGSYLCFIDINSKKKVYEASSKTEVP
jgi:flagellar hook assembly protein FlgD